MFSLKKIYFNQNPWRLLTQMITSLLTFESQATIKTNFTTNTPRSTWALTFIIAFLAVHDGNLVTSETRSPMELTVVLVQFPIWATHRFVVWFAVIQTLALPLFGLMVDHTVTSQTTILMFTWAWMATVSQETWRRNENTSKVEQ